MRYGAIWPYQAFNFGLLGVGLAHGAGRAATGARPGAGSCGAARAGHHGGRSDKPGQGPLYRARHPRSRGRRGKTAGYQARYPWRAAGVHPRHRGASAGVAGADSGIRFACRGAGRFRGDLHHSGGQLRGDGSRLQHRRGHPGLRHRPGFGRNTGQQGGKRRGGPDSQHRPGTRAQRRTAGGHRPRSCVLHSAGSAGRQRGGLHRGRHRRSAVAIARPHGPDPGGAGYAGHRRARDARPGQESAGKPAGVPGRPQRVLPAADHRWPRNSYRAVQPGPDCSGGGGRDMPGSGFRRIG